MDQLGTAYRGRRSSTCRTGKDHNGIIENYASIKEEMIKRGHVFNSDTDTEVLIHLIEDVQKNENTKMGYAVQAALKQVIGAYAIVLLDKNDPDVIVAAKKGSPMVIGIGHDDFVCHPNGCSFCFDDPR